VAINAMGVQSNGKIIIAGRLRATPVSRLDSSPSRS
jgi:hypothetical protein